MGILNNFRKAQERKIAFTDLPEDIQQLIVDLTPYSHLRTEADAENYSELTFDIVQVRLDELPDFTEKDSYRQDWEEPTGIYVDEMTKANDLPPIIFNEGEMVDGVHRIMAARQRGDEVIDSIDISQV